MSIRHETRARCRTRKVRVIAMTKNEWEITKKLGIDIKNYCKQPSVRKRMVTRYKFGGRR